MNKPLSKESAATLAAGIADVKAGRVSLIPMPTAQPGTSTRGHVESQLGRKMCVCLACKQKKPKRGGWAAACPKDGRVFIGDANA